MAIWINILILLRLATQSARLSQPLPLHVCYGTPSTIEVTAQAKQQKKDKDKKTNNYAQPTRVVGIIIQSSRLLQKRSSFSPSFVTIAL